MRTPTSSQYPVLENKPIDQWKVTELKEELKRRRLKTGGLKDELIRRLDEALRAEMDDTTVEAGNDHGMKESASDTLTEHPAVEAGDSGSVTFANAEETMGSTGGVVGDVKDNVTFKDNVGNAEQTTGNTDKPVGVAEEVVDDTFVGSADAKFFPSEMDVKDTVKQVTEDAKFGEQQSGLGNDPVMEGLFTTTDIAPVVVGDVSEEKQLDLGIPDVSPVVVGDNVSEEQQLGLVDDPVEEAKVTATDVASVVMGDEISEGFLSEKSVGVDGLVSDKMVVDYQNSGVQERSEDVTPAHEEVKLDSPDQTNQVSEVSTSLGFPVKSNNFVSTDSLSVFEKNDLKDNLIADNVKLESDVKPEMVLPSSSDLVPDGDESHPRDVDQSHENKVSVEETDNTVTNADISQKNFSANLGSAEQLNLDRSSGDDSMEDDALEGKQNNSNLKFEDVGEKTEKNEITTVQVENSVATAMDTDLPVEKKVLHDQKIDVVTLPDKRKFSDEEPAVNNKPAKRQHRWKKESNNATELPISDIPLPSPQDVPQSAALRRSFSRSDSIGANDPPKEREVPPSSKPATNSLRIDHFLRPFTLKAVQELLGKTGTVGSFWMDHIKTHCYVTYSSIEEAVETRNAVYNLQWPPNGGRQLVAEFVDPEEVNLRLNPPATPANHVNSAPTKGPEVVTAPLPSPRPQSLRLQSKLPPPPPPVILNQVPVRERLLPPPPPIEKVDAPIVTLDDLFRKTKATPRIYYLPLSDEEVAAKQKNPKQ